MTTTIVIVAVIAVGGLYLRWATGPVLTADQAGRQAGRVLTTVNRRAVGLGRASRGTSSTPGATGRQRPVTGRCRFRAVSPPMPGNGGVGRPLVFGT